MPIHPAHVGVDPFFGGDHIFVVPRYQRGYTWDQPHVEDFIRDLTACYQARRCGTSRHHFFGAVVAVEQYLPGSTWKQYEVIDGQQRLATFVLLASELERQYRQLETPRKGRSKEMCGLAGARARQLHDRFVQIEIELNRQLLPHDRLTLSQPDKSFFSDLICHRDASPRATRESHQRLLAARDRVRDWINGLLSEHHTLRAQLDALLPVSEVLQQDATLIYIATDDRTEAYRLFQVLNDRGTSLSDGDLLRAATLELLGEDRFEQEHNNAAVYWDDILRDDPADTERILRWYFASVHGERPGQSSLFDEFLAAFFPQSKKPSLAKRDGTEIQNTVRQVREAVNRCRLLLEGDWPYEAGSASLWERDRLAVLVGGLGHSNCVPLLLAACECLSEGDFSRLVQLTERIAVRYKLICNQHIGSLTKIYHEQAVAMRKVPKSYRVATLRQAYEELQARKADDDMFRSALLRLRYEEGKGNAVIKYLLMTLEHYWRWFSEGARGNPKCRDTTRVLDFKATTVEHVYPRKATAGDRRADMEERKHSLGNLTFLGPEDNRQLANASFRRKKEMLTNSSIQLNRDISRRQSWGKAALESRQRQLCDAAIKVLDLRIG